MDKAQLERALEIFLPWLEHEARDASLNVAASFSASSTTLPEVAEQVGLARGISAAGELLSMRVAALMGE